MKLTVKILSALLFLVPASCWAQGSRYSSTVFSSRGLPLPGVNIAVCTAGASTSTAPCSPLATIYTDATDTTAATNPFATDSLGNFGFWAVPGKYQVQIYGGGIVTQVITTVLPCDPSNSCTVSGSVTLSAIASGSVSALGTATVTANFNSGDFSLHASEFYNSIANDDPWTFRVVAGASGASQFEIIHGAGNGSGQFLPLSDLVVGPPGTATASANFNGHTLDVEDSYWDGSAAQDALLEVDVQQTPNSGVPTAFRFIDWPFSTGSFGTATVQRCFGGSGSNGSSGFLATAPILCITPYKTVGNITATFDFSGLTANRTITWPDAAFTVPSPGTAVTWIANQTFTAPVIINGGSLSTPNLLLNSSSPTISSGFGTTPSIATSNGTASFTINVGTGGTATSGVIGLPAATNGWNVFCNDQTTFSTTVFLTRQTATTTTTSTIGNFNSSATAAAWAANDTLSCVALAR